MEQEPQPSIPEVRIKANLRLLGNVSGRLLEAAKAKGEWPKDTELPEVEEIREKTKAYREEWEKDQGKILSGLQEVFELEFYKSVLDVHIAPFFIAQGKPIIMHSGYEPDVFVDVLIHELIHVLLIDNTTYKDGDKLSNLWSKLYQGKAWNTRVHIPVHAGSKHIYLDVLDKPQKLERDKQRAKYRREQGFEGYHESWEYVEEHGYIEIIEEFKAHYDELRG